MKGDYPMKVTETLERGPVKLTATITLPAEYWDNLNREEHGRLLKDFRNADLKSLPITVDSILGTIAGHAPEDQR